AVNPCRLAPGIRRCFAAGRERVQSTLDFARALPPAGSLVGSRRWCRALYASKTSVSLVQEGVVGYLVPLNVRPHLFSTPRCQGIHFEDLTPALQRVSFNRLNVAAGGRLIPTQSSHPAVDVGQQPLHR